MIFDAIHDTVTCSVCGYARGIHGAGLQCLCCGWVAFFRSFMAADRARRLARTVMAARKEPDRG